MIPFPEVFAYQEPVDGQVLVATFRGDLRLPGFLEGRRTIVVAVADDVGDSRVTARVPTPEPVADETRQASAAAELAVDVGQPARAGDGHGDTVDERVFDPFCDPPDLPFAGRELVDVDTGGRV